MLKEEQRFAASDILIYSILHLKAEELYADIRTKKRLYCAFKRTLSISNYADRRTLRSRFSALIRISLYTFFGVLSIFFGSFRIPQTLFQAK